MGAEKEIEQRQGEDEGQDPIVPKKRKRWPIAVIVTAIVLITAGAGAWIWHEQPSFCGTVCHNTMGSYVESWENSNFTVRAHAEQDVACLDCHEATVESQIAEATKQLSGDYVLPFRKMQTDDGFCLRDGCHTRAEVEQEGTIVDSLGIKANPHTQVINKNDPFRPHEGTEETLACSDCHAMHRKSPGVEKQCYSCHHNETFQACSSCHDDK